MDAPSKGKRGPKKGWLDKLHADLAKAEDEAQFYKDLVLFEQKNINYFNNLPWWRKLWFVISGEAL